MTLNENVRVQCLVWSIADAKDALKCAMLMESWEGVKKYANQIQSMEKELYQLQHPTSGIVVKPTGRYLVTG